jgi:hypothetical protein
LSRRRTITVSAVALAAAAAVTGWVATTGNDSRPAPVRSTATTVAPNQEPRSEPEPQPATVTPPPLATVLVDDAPAGYVELRPGAGPGGTFDLNSFLTSSDDPARDRLLLSANHFEAGQVRSWERDGPDGPRRLVASVFQFRSASDAVTFLVRKKDQTITGEGAGEFPVSSGIGLRYAHHDGSTTVYSYTIAFHVDNQLFYLGAFAPTDQPPAEILTLEANQRERIDRLAAT